MRSSRIIASIASIVTLVCIPVLVGAVDPFEINVIASLTGQSALGGKQVTDSLHVIETQVNRTGGIGGRPIKFVVQDDQTNPQVAVSLASQIIAKKAQLILGPQITANCNAVSPVVQDSAVLWCYSPGFHPPKGSFGFSSNASTAALIQCTVRYLHALGLNKIALLATTDATGQDGARNLDAAIAAPEVAGMSVVEREYFNAADISIAAQISRIKSSGAQALIAWATLTPLGTVFREAKAAGLNIPIATTNANSSSVQIKGYESFVPDTLLIASMFNQVADKIPNGPIKRKVDEFYGAYKAQLGFLPEGSANLAWDSTLLLIDALRKYGTTATAQQIHDYLENLHGWVGINGVYDFRTGDQRGLGVNDVLMTRWDPVKGAFGAISKAGGLP